MKKYLTSLILILLVFILTGVGQSKPNETEIKDINVNGKSYKGKFKIFLSNNGEVWTQIRITDNKFSVPLYLQESEKLSIKFLFGKHQFVFTDIHKSKFGDEWFVGIDDNAPFSEDYISLEEQENVRRIYYLRSSKTQIVISEDCN